MPLFFEPNIKQYMYRFGNTTEDMCIQKIEGAIRGIKLGTKKPEDTGIGKFLAKLKPLNEAMYDDLLEKYKVVKEEYDKKNQK